MGKLKVIVEPGKLEVKMTRVFDAPRELVFKAHIDPKAIPQWWGRRNSKTTVDKMEVRDGGRWRFVERGSDGQEHGFHGVFHAIVPSERIVQTFEYEGVPGHVLLETLAFEEMDGKTILTGQSVFQSVEDRDGMVASGMEQGANETHDRLEELLASQR